MGHATAHFPPRLLGPWEGSKGQISLNFNYKVNCKDFHTKLCVSSHKLKIYNISNKIFILSPGLCPWRVGLGGAGGSKIYFSEHGQSAYQIKEDDK